jgi:hypothetical protein
MFTHIAVVRDLVDTQYKEYQEVSIWNSGGQVSGTLGCDVCQLFQASYSWPPANPRLS